MKTHLGMLHRLVDYAVAPFSDVKAHLGVLQRLVEFAVAALVAIEALIFFSSILHGHISMGGVAQYVNDHVGPFMEKANTSALVSAVILLLIIKLSRRYQDGTKYDELATECTELRSFIERYRTCEQYFRTFAYQNADCDRTLFDTIFVEWRTGRMSPVAARQACVTTIWQNIIQTLDTSRDIFTGFTADTCSACIQILNAVDGQSADGGVISTIARDSRSRTERTSGKTGEKIKDNTIHRKIFIDRNVLFFCDNLNALNDAGEFSTSSDSWSNLYNAVLVVVIPNMLPDGDIGPPRATLCIDNKNGGFSAPFAQHTARDSLGA